MRKDATKPKLTVGQMWRRELSVVRAGDVTDEQFNAAVEAVLALNPTLGMSNEAMYFTVQGWLAAHIKMATPA